MNEVGIGMTASHVEGGVATRRVVYPISNRYGTAEWNAMWQTVARIVTFCETPKMIELRLMCVSLFSLSLSLSLFISLSLSRSLSLSLSLALTTHTLSLSLSFALAILYPRSYTQQNRRGDQAAIAATQQRFEHHQGELSLVTVTYRANPSHRLTCSP